MAKGSTAVYLYCVVRAARRPSLSRVPARTRRRLATRCAQAVLFAVAHHGRGPAGCLWAGAPVVATARSGLGVGDRPRARGGDRTFFARPGRGGRADEALHDVLVDGQGDRRHRPAGKTAIERAMRHIAGSEEWGVRITRRPAAPLPHPARPQPACPGPRFSPQGKKHAMRPRSVRAASLAAADQAFNRLEPPRQGRQQRPRRQEPGTNPSDSRSRVSRHFRLAGPLQGGGETAGGAVRVGRSRHDADRARGPPTISSAPRRSPREATTWHAGRVRPSGNLTVRCRAGDRVTRPFHPLASHDGPIPRAAARKEAARAAAARADAEAGVEGAENHESEAGRRADPGRGILVARSDRQPAEQGGHAQRGTDPGARRTSTWSTSGCRRCSAPPIACSASRGPARVMAWYVFALVDAIPAGRAGKGLTGPLSIRKLAGAFAVVERRADVPPVEFGRLKKHQEVVTRLARQVPAILPVRFGTLLERRPSRRGDAGARRGDRGGVRRRADRVQFTWRIKRRESGIAGVAESAERRSTEARTLPKTGAEYLRRAARAANPAPPAAFRALALEAGAADRRNNATRPRLRRSRSGLSPRGHCERGSLRRPRAAAVRKTSPLAHRHGALSALCLCSGDSVKGARGARVLEVLKVPKVLEVRAKGARVLEPKATELGRAGRGEGDRGDPEADRGRRVRAARRAGTRIPKTCDGPC